MAALTAGSTPAGASASDTDGICTSGESITSPAPPLVTMCSTSEYGISWRSFDAFSRLRPRASRSQSSICFLK